MTLDELPASFSWTVSCVPTATSAASPSAESGPPAAPVGGTLSVVDVVDGLLLEKSSVVEPDGRFVVSWRGGGR